MKYAIMENNKVSSFVEAANEGIATEILKKLVELEEIVDDASILPYDGIQGECEINEKYFTYSIEHSYGINTVESMKRYVFNKIAKYSVDYNEYGEAICILFNGTSVAMRGDIYIDYAKDIIYESVDIIKRKSQYEDYIYSYGLVRI